MPSFAITRDGVRVAYESIGRGPPLVLVHGLGDERTLWQPVIEQLAPHFSCVALDLRGHGQTTGATDYEPFGLQRDVEAVVRDARLRRPVLVGHSLGAFVATTYAASFPSSVRAVVNIDQPLAFDGLAGAVRAHHDALQAGHVRQTLMDVLAQLGLGPISPALRERLERTREALASEVVLGVWGPLLDGGLPPMLARVDRMLEQLSRPYLHLLGHEPQPTYAGWLSARAPAIELEGWRDMGHFLHLLEPARFATRVRDFIVAH